jgi:hypothetical protein
MADEDVPFQFATKPETITDFTSALPTLKAKNVSEIVALIAYYFAHLAPVKDRRNYITASDVEMYFTLANYPLPDALLNAALTNAMQGGYLISHDNEQYQLNPELCAAFDTRFSGISSSNGGQ